MSVNGQEAGQGPERAPVEAVQLAGAAAVAAESGPAWMAARRAQLLAEGAAEAARYERTVHGGEVPTTPHRHVSHDYRIGGITLGAI